MFFKCSWMDVHTKLNSSIPECFYNFKSATNVSRNQLLKLLSFIYYCTLRMVDRLGCHWINPTKCDIWINLIYKYINIGPFQKLEQAAALGGMLWVLPTFLLRNFLWATTELTLALFLSNITTVLFCGNWSLSQLCIWKLLRYIIKVRPFSTTHLLVYTSQKFSEPNAIKQILFHILN